MKIYNYMISLAILYKEYVHDDLMEISSNAFMFDESINIGGLEDMHYIIPILSELTREQ